MAKRVALGMVWINIQIRPFYSIREISRGKDRGKLEIEYQKSAGYFKKIIVRQDDIERMFE